MTLRLEGWSASDERTRRFGEPKGWQDIEGSSAAGGSFRLTFEAPRAYQFTLQAACPGTCEATWCWSTLQQGAEIDLGETTLIRSGTVSASVVDGPRVSVSAGEVTAADITYDGRTLLEGSS